MSRRRQNRRRAVADINVVPYIDVMLVLLIIFMVTTPLLSQGVKVNLPKAAAKALTSKNQTPLIVNVNARGEYFLNTAGKIPLTANRLTDRVQSALKRNPKRKVYVRGDSAANYGKVVGAMVLLQRAGVGEVGLMTQSNHKDHG